MNVSYIQIKKKNYHTILNCCIIFSMRSNSSMSGRISRPYFSKQNNVRLTRSLSLKRRTKSYLEKIVGEGLVGRPFTYPSFGLETFSFLDFDELTALQGVSPLWLSWFEKPRNFKMIEGIIDEKFGESFREHFKIPKLKNHVKTAGNKVVHILRKIGGDIADICHYCSDTKRCFYNGKILVFNADLLVKYEKWFVIERAIHRV